MPTAKTRRHRCGPAETRPASSARRTIGGGVGVRRRSQMACLAALGTTRGGHSPRLPRHPDASVRRESSRYPGGADVPRLGRAADASDAVQPRQYGHRRTKILVRFVRQRRARGPAPDEALHHCFAAPPPRPLPRRCGRAGRCPRRRPTTPAAPHRGRPHGLGRRRAVEVSASARWGGRCAPSSRFKLDVMYWHAACIG